MRHRLTEKLRAPGGHIGLYLCRDRRSRGLAKKILRRVLTGLRTTAEPRALLTLAAGHLLSIRSAESAGDRREDVRPDPVSGLLRRRYWIALPPGLLSPPESRTPPQNRIPPLEIGYSTLSSPRSRPILAPRVCPNSIRIVPAVPLA